MRLHALLCWYDEPPNALAACVASLTIANVDHLVAVDGAYLLYPDGKPSSPPDQAATIQQTAQALGIAATIHTPNERWAGNEVEKRTRMFSLALAASDPGDWWLSIDADMLITQAPHDLHQQLQDAEVDAARATLTEYRDLDDTQTQAQQFHYPRTSQYPMRLLFRAQPLACAHNHCTYRTPDARVLWSAQAPITEEPGTDLPDLVVEHRHNQRTVDREQARAAYYSRRDYLGVEREKATA